MANDVYRLVILGSSAGEFFENVLHYKSNETSGADPTAAAISLINQWRDTVESAMADVMAADTSLVGYKCKRINNGGSPTISVPITPVPGTVAGTSATSATASLLLLPFIRAAKFFTGKIFIPGLAESRLEGNALNGAQVTALGTLISALLSTLTITPFSYDIVVWSRTVSLPFVPFDIVISNKVGIQRRRLLPVI